MPASLANSEYTSPVESDSEDIIQTYHKKVISRETRKFKSKQERQRQRRHTTKILEPSPDFRSNLTRSVDLVSSMSRDLSQEASDGEGQLALLEEQHEQERAEKSVLDSYTAALQSLQLQIDTAFDCGNDRELNTLLLKFLECFTRTFSPHTCEDQESTYARLKSVESLQQEGSPQQPRSKKKCVNMTRVNETKLKPCILKARRNIWITTQQLLTLAIVRDTVLSHSSANIDAAVIDPMQSMHVFLSKYGNFVDIETVIVHLNRRKWHNCIHVLPKFIPNAGEQRAALDRVVQQVIDEHVVPATRALLAQVSTAILLEYLPRICAIDTRRFIPLCIDAYPRILPHNVDDALSANVGSSREFMAFWFTYLDGLVRRPNFVPEYQREWRLLRHYLQLVLATQRTESPIFLSCATPNDALAMQWNPKLACDSWSNVIDNNENLECKSDNAVGSFCLGTEGSDRFSDEYVDDANGDSFSSTWDTEDLVAIYPGELSCSASTCLLPREGSLSSAIPSNYWEVICNRKFQQAVGQNFICNLLLWTGCWLEVTQLLPSSNPLHIRILLATKDNNAVVRWLRQSGSVDLLLKQWTTLPQIARMSIENLATLVAQELGLSVALRMLIELSVKYHSPDNDSEDLNTHGSPTLDPKLAPLSLNDNEIHSPPKDSQVTASQPLSDIHKNLNHSKAPSTTGRSNNCLEHEIVSELRSTLPKLLARWLSAFESLQDILRAHHNIATAVDGHLWTRTESALPAGMEMLLKYSVVDTKERPSLIQRLLTCLNADVTLAAKQQTTMFDPHLEHSMIHWGAVVHVDGIASDGTWSSPVYSKGIYIHHTGEVEPAIFSRDDPQVRTFSSIM